MKTIADIKAHAEQSIEDLTREDGFRWEIQDQRTILALCEIVEFQKDYISLVSQEYLTKVAEDAYAEEFNNRIAKIGEI